MGLCPFGNTKYGDFDACLKSSAAKQDVITPFVSALRKNNLKMGIFISLRTGPIRDYTHFTRDFHSIQCNATNPKDGIKFLSYIQGQLKELFQITTNPGLVFAFVDRLEHQFRGMGSAQGSTQMLFGQKSQIPFLNSRLREQGIYATPEPRNAHHKAQKTNIGSYVWPWTIPGVTKKMITIIKPPIKLSGFLLMSIANGRR